MHPVIITALVTTVNVGVITQASVAVALPNAASITEAEGLQPSESAVPVALITGAIVSRTLYT